MKRKLSLIMALAMVAALFAVFAIPASAKTTSKTPMGDLYEAILGEHDIAHRIFDLAGAGNEYSDWTVEAEVEGMPDVPGGVYHQNLSAGLKNQHAPAYRISHVYIPADATFEDTEEYAVNWMFVYKTLYVPLCQNYNFNSGIVRPATMDWRGTIVEQNPVPENERRGFIQFIDTVEFDGSKMTQKTYANGKLVLHTEVDGSLTWNQVRYQFFSMNSNPAWVPEGGNAAALGAAPAYLEKGVRTTAWLSFLNAPVSESSVTGLYNAFANRYGKDVKWYPQDVTKNGLIIGKGGIRLYENGEYKTGWEGEVGNSRYFYKETGYLVTEDRTIGGVPCAYDESTLKMTFVDGPFGDFYFENGVKKTGWLDATHYYYLETGKKCVDTRTIGGVYYEYDLSADALNKQQGLIDEDGDTFYLVDGVKQGGWQQIDGDWYYFYKETKVMVVNATIKILGVEHTFDADGICQDYNK